MLVGNSVPEYIFIRCAIFGLRIIAPLSIAYIIALALQAAATSDTIRLPVIVEVYLYLEAAFFFVVYLPFRFWLQSAASHPEALKKDERQALFKRILNSVSHVDHYLSGWFLGVPIEEIDRISLKDFLAWSLMNEHLEKLDTSQNAELDTYIDALEEKLGHKLSTTKGTSRSLRTTFDEVPMQHRPLLWYLIVCFVDSITHLRLLASSCGFYRSSLASTVLTFPFRPLALLGRRQKSSARLSYWYKAHTSKTKRPIVFIHGIGVGLYPYVDFLLQTMSQGDGDVGIIIIEILPISSRICPPALRTIEMKAQIQQMLDSHGWTDFVLIGHSYGTAIASTILRDPVFSQRVKASMLLDPICFLLHLPDVAYNFTRRRPRQANERMLHYFSSQDMLISHTLARRFFWSEYVLWKEDLNDDVSSTVVLSAKDLIVPTTEVWDYLTGSTPCDTEVENIEQLAGTIEWKEDKRQVLWFKEFDHAGLFSSKGARRGVARIAHKLCTVDP